MKLQVTSAAQRDLAEAYDWYEAKANGLGKAMIATVDGHVPVPVCSFHRPRLSFLHAV